jgi:hypothetical protein
MDLQTTKLDVIKKIMNVSTTPLLEKVNKLLEKEMTVGYTVEGKPLTKESYNARLRIAEKQIRSGQYLTQEDLEKEVDNW